MRDPLDSMYLRTAELDQANTDPAVTARLKHSASPVGGAFGKVRSSGTKPHQGWDIYADIGTFVYAVSSGVIEGVRESQTGYGLQLCLKLDREPMTRATGPKPQLWAFYAHLSRVLVSEGHVEEGQLIAFTGNSGNADDTPPHLHFELRTQPWPGKGLKGRLDPGEALGYWHYQSR
jgi:murein DD-endopeptidase MepM/ murein hydrolase activator NlpD